MVFYSSFSDGMSFQISRTILSIPADLNNAVVQKVSTSPVISKSPSPCTDSLEIPPRAPITINKIISFMFTVVFNFKILFPLFAFF